MLTDSLCLSTWRARPVTFVSLMMLYESNYVRLRRVVDDVRGLSGSAVSSVAGDCDLHLDVIEQAPYTSILRLTYLFEDAATPTADPDLELRVYHDARLVEASRCGRWIRHPTLRSIRSSTSAVLGERWLRNMMLNKWLDYLEERGHRFARALLSTRPALHEPA